MKTKIQRYAKSTLALSMALIASMMVTACGKKKSAGPAPVVVPVAPAAACPNCAAGGQFLFSSLSGVFDGYTGQSNIELGLQFHSNGPTQLASGQDPYAMYSGPSFAYGTMYVVQNTTPTLCNLPAGNYQVRPFEGRPAELYFDTVHEMYLEAVGPTRVLLYVARGITDSNTLAQIGKDSKTYPFRLKGLMYLKSDSGGTCSRFLE
ncbi:MAG: hypothetical protein NDI61_06790 [Bdellovibrionaceae bacterium]|nr:hypothetical protein [Pseudobdellovibrionaceae bacterium]